MTPIHTERDLVGAYDELATQIRNVATFQTPILATLEGRVVQLIATSAQPGHSPAFQYVDENGRANWEAQTKFTVIDPHCLPPSTERMRQTLTTLAP